VVERSDTTGTFGTLRVRIWGFFSQIGNKRSKIENNKRMISLNFPSCNEVHDEKPTARFSDGGQSVGYKLSPTET
jgi:hypothetical protein